MPRSFSSGRCLPRISTSCWSWSRSRGFCLADLCLLSWRCSGLLDNGPGAVLLSAPASSLGPAASGPGFPSSGLPPGLPAGGVGSVLQPGWLQQGFSSRPVLLILVRPLGRKFLHWPYSRWLLGSADFRPHLSMLPNKAATFGRDGQDGDVRWQPDFADDGRDHEVS